MISQLNYKWLFSLIAVMLLAGCSGGSDSSADLSAGGQIFSGIAVDPYIENAVFQEIEAGTNDVLQESLPTDENGIITFPQPLTPGSLVELKDSDKGLHGGAPYLGMLRRVVTADDEQPLVVSPLTTLLANGITPEELIAIFTSAGLPDLTVTDLYTDPMNGLSDMNGVTVDDLRLLQAAMAANAYMEITGNFETDMGELSDPVHSVIFNSMVNSIANLLDPEEFAAIKETLSNDPDVTTPVILEDFILAVLADQQTIIALTKESMGNSGDFNPVLVEQAVQDAMDNAVANVKLCYSQRVPSSTVYDGALLYHDNCSSCHQPLDVTTKAGATASDIQTAIDTLSMMSSLNTLTEGEIAAIADALQPAQTPGPVTPVSLDGAALYSTNCGSCHGELNTSSKSGKNAAQIQAAIDTNIGNMGFLNTLTPDEVQAIANALQPTAAATPNPGTVTPLDGNSLYSINCAGCHGQLDVTAKPGRTAADIQAAIDTNIGNMGFLNTLTPDEVQAIADVLPLAPVADPTQPLDGAVLYSTNCAGCHGQLDVTAKPGRTAADIQAAIDTNIGNMGFLNTLTPDEVQAIADVLPAASGGTSGPDYSDCTACHGQPPVGDTYPDTAGAHTVHAALASVGNDCSICHQGAAHNSQVDLGFPASFDAKSGPATNNLDGTCSSIKCHGGQTTPDWWSGSIAVDTQCTACHTSGSSQYNSYSSGRHSKHIGQGYSCTVCHNTTTLSNGHFSNLETSTFEQSPADTIGGGSTSVGSYSNGTCSSIACHGSESW